MTAHDGLQSTCLWCQGIVVGTKTLAPARRQAPYQEGGKSRSLGDRTQCQEGSSKLQSLVRYPIPMGPASRSSYPYTIRCSRHACLESHDLGAIQQSCNEDTCHRALLEACTPNTWLQLLLAEGSNTAGWLRLKNSEETSALQSGHRYPLKNSRGARPLKLHHRAYFNWSTRTYRVR